MSEPVTLRPMRADEFPAYHDYFIVDYGEEIAANYGYTLEKSVTIAREELADDLPQTVNTPHHTLLCIEKEGATVGYLWYNVLDAGKTIFILDFVIFELLRRRGYGKAAMLALETVFSQRGGEQIKLRVACHNKRALQLYEAIGFNITGYNMIKHIKGKR